MQYPINDNPSFDLPLKVSLKELPKVILVKETGKYYELVRTKAKKVMLQALDKKV